MRIALLADIHSNSIALDAVLDDINARGGAGADLLAGGHSHRPVDRTIAGVRYVNPGAVSNSPLPDLRAGYALLQTSAGGYALTLHRVDYDRQAAAALLHEQHCPNADFVAAILLHGAWRL